MSRYSSQEIKEHLPEFLCQLISIFPLWNSACGNGGRRTGMRNEWAGKDIIVMAYFVTPSEDVSQKTKVGLYNFAKKNYYDRYIHYKKINDKWNLFIKYDG